MLFVILGSTQDPEPQTPDFAALDPSFRWDDGRPAPNDRANPRLSIGSRI